MSMKIKILITIMETMFFVISVFSPGNTAPLAVIMTISIVVSWAFTSKQKTTISKILVGFYLAVFLLALMVCIFLGFTSELKMTSPGIYQFQFYRDMAFLGSVIVPYEKFFWFIVPIYMILTVGDIINFAILQNTKTKTHGVNDK